MRHIRQQELSVAAATNKLNSYPKEQMGELHDDRLYIETTSVPGLLYLGSLNPFFANFMHGDFEDNKTHLQSQSGGNA